MSGNHRIWGRASQIQGSLEYTARLSQNKTKPKTKNQPHKLTVNITCQVISLHVSVTGGPSQHNNTKGVSCCDTTPWLWPKAICVGKGLFYLQYQVVSIPSLREVRRKTQAGQELKQALRACWLTSLACFVTVPGPSAHHGTTCNNSLGPPHQSPIKNLSYRPSTGQPGGGIFSVDLSSWPVNLTLKVASTGGKVFKDESRQVWEYGWAVNDCPCMHKALSSIARTM